jgi:hypothetical protein
MSAMEPIFCVGCQRSGTTFLGSLLGGDARTIAIPEAQFVADLAPASADTTPDARAVIDAIERHDRFRLWQFDLAGARPHPSLGYADTIRWLVRRYAAAHGRADPVRWVDHQPGHVKEMAELRVHFPRLKAIHIVRDGRAVAASLLPVHWGPNSVIGAARFWAQRVAMGQALRDFLPAGQFVQVRYEDIVRNPECQMRALADFCGMPYDPALTAGTGFAVPGFTRNQHALVGRPPDPSRLESWRDALSPREIEMFEAMVGPLLTYLGYARDFDHGARLPTAAEKARAVFADQGRGAVNLGRFRRRVRAFAR